TCALPIWSLAQLLGLYSQLISSQRVGSFYVLINQTFIVMFSNFRITVVPGKKVKMSTPCSIQSILLSSLYRSVRRGLKNIHIRIQKYSKPLLNALIFMYSAPRQHINVSTNNFFK